MTVGLIQITKNLGPISTESQRRANARNFTFQYLFAVKIGPSSTCFIPHFIFFSVRERAKFSKSFNLVGSGSERNRCLSSRDCYVATFYLFIYLFIKNVCLEPFKWPLLLRKKKFFGETCFFNLDYLYFHYYLLARNCPDFRQSSHDYSPKMFGSFARLSLSCRKKIKMLFTSLGRSLLGKIVLSFLSSTLDLRPRAVSKLSLIHI